MNRYFKSLFPYTVTALSCLVLLLHQTRLAAAEDHAPNSDPQESQLDEEGEDELEFFPRYFHTYNTDYQYYFLRKNQHLNTVLAGVSMQQSSEGALDIEAKAFLPLYQGEKISFVLPFYFYRYGFSNSQEKALPHGAVHATFWQAIFNAKLSESLSLAIITEGRHNGTERSQWRLPGTEMAEFVVLKWDASPTWTFSPAFRVKASWDGKRDRHLQILPAGNIIWRPKKNLAVMTGLPSFLALEWASDYGVDVVAHVMLAEGNNINAMSAVRVHLGSQLSIATRFLRDGFQDLYVPEFAYQDSSHEGLVDQISQYKNRLQLELEVAATKHSTLQLKGGYIFDEGITVSDSDAKITTIDGSDGVFFGVTFVSHFNLDALSHQRRNLRAKE